MSRVFLLTFLGVLVGCGSDQQLTDPTLASLKGPRPGPGGHGPGPRGVPNETTPVGDHGIITCDRQTYAVATRLIGPSGGSLKAGRHEFKVPAGALTSTIQITMEAVADTVHSVRFSPEGLVFKPHRLPELKLDYHGCKMPKGPHAKIAYVTESLDIISIVRSVDDTLNSNADGQLEHFSRYAVAW